MHAAHHGPAAQTAQRRYLALAIVLLVISTLTMTSTAAAQPAKTRPEVGFADLRPVPDQAATGGGIAGEKDTWIVTFKHGSDRAAEVRNARAVGMTVGRELSHAFSGAIVKGTAAQAEKLRHRGAVMRVERSMPIESYADQTGADLSWGLDRIDQRSLPLNGRYRYERTGSGVIAYVIDTGMNSSHAEFSDRIVGSAWAVGTSAEDCNGHGTHVSGTVGGSVFGVAKEIWFVPVRVLECDGRGTTDAWVSALDWIIQNHPVGYPAVINMSLGTINGRSTSAEAAVATAVSRGFTVVVAAGNSAIDACTRSPAAEPTAITVANATRADAEAETSNYGSCVDIYAPGTDIPSAWIGSSTASMTISGTSMASPHVAGAAALLLQANPSLPPNQVAAQLISDSTKGVITNPYGGTPNRLLYIPTSTPVVTATAPTFTDLCGTDSDTFTVPRTTGVNYFRDLGVSLSPVSAGTYAASGTVRIVAQPQAGYTLSGTTSWSRVFTDSSGFTDVTRATPFFREICWLSNSGVTKGHPDGTFRPGDPVRRDAMSAFMHRLAGSPAWTPPSTSPFTDVPTTRQFYKEITWLASTGVTNGYNDGTFRPSLTVNRDAMAAFMYRLAGSPAWTPPAASPFTDVPTTRQFYKEITWLASTGITNGYSDGTFRPNHAVNRDAMAAFMYRFKVVKKLI